LLPSSYDLCSSSAYKSTLTYSFCSNYFCGLSSYSSSKKFCSIKGFCWTIYFCGDYW